MDRRSAIKKLAAGTAIAAGGSMVLSSRDVAYAASGGVDPGSLPSGSLAGFLTTNANGALTITITDQPTCAGGGPVSSTTYTWGSLTEIDVSPSVKSIDMTSSGNSATIVGRKNNGTQKDFKRNDQLSVEVMINWECSGGLSESRAYRIMISYPDVTSSNQL